MITLTKQDFWDPLKEKYPKAMAHFEEWIDTYKSEHDWEKLFSSGAQMSTYHGAAKFTSYETKAPKYHELPIAMQFGIFLEYVYEYYTKYNLWNPEESGVKLKHNTYERMAITAINSIIGWLEGRL